MNTIPHRRALTYILPQILSEHPDGLSPTQVYNLVNEQYTFPKEWYLQRPTTSGYEFLKSHGYTDWLDVPQTELVAMVSTEPQWRYFLRWARERIKADGQLDRTATGHLWRLNDKGRKAAKRLSVKDYHPEELVIISSRRTPTNRLLREPDHPELTADEIPITPTAVDVEEPQPSRVEVHTYRVLRDTLLARKLKALHQDSCQICGTRISLGDNTYSEAHHIRPLSNPHNGPDVPENILVLCPNHHVMCDYGAIRLDISGLRTHPNHRLGRKFIEYYNQQIANL